MVKEFRITVASGEEGGVAGKRNEGAFWHNGNVLFLDGVMVTFTEIHQTVYWIPMHFRVCKLHLKTALLAFKIYFKTNL